MKNPLIGVVVVTYNSSDTIVACLDSVLTAQYQHKKIVVIDNASTDTTQEIIHEKFKTISFIENKENVGFSAANNLGIQKLLKDECEYILLLNPDAEIQQELFENLLKLFRQKSVGIGGCAIVYPDLNRVWFAGGIFNKLFCYTRHRKLNKSVESLDNGVHDTDFVTGCCMLIRRSVFEKIGFLDSSFGFYFEDVDFCVRAREAGFICRIIEKPLVLHRVSFSSGVAGSNRLTAFKAYFYGRNPFFLIKKHMKGVSVVSAFFGQFFIRLPFHALSMVKNRDFDAIFAYLKGMRDGVFQSK